MSTREAIMLVITVISIVQWIKWKIITQALIYYNEKNQYKHPGKTEMGECIGFVVENTIKDLIGR